MIPVVGYVGAGAEIYSIDDHFKGGGLDELQAPLHVPADSVALIVRGDSMYPEVDAGTRVIYRREVDFDEAQCLGKRCVVKLEDGHLFLKRLTRGSQYGRYTLISVNAPPIENVEIEWAAPVMAYLPS
jgi:phage repressor protein C with HTH and peptisase S24 domain